MLARTPCQRLEFVPGLDAGKGMPARAGPGAHAYPGDQSDPISAMTRAEGRKACDGPRPGR